MLAVLIAIVGITVVISITVHAILTDTSFLDMLEKRKVENTKIEIEKLRLQQISMGFPLSEKK